MHHHQTKEMKCLKTFGSWEGLPSIIQQIYSGETDCYNTTLESRKHWSVSHDSFFPQLIGESNHLEYGDKDTWKVCCEGETTNMRHLEKVAVVPSDVYGDFDGSRNVILRKETVEQTTFDANENKENNLSKQTVPGQHSKPSPEVKGQQPKVFDGSECDSAFTQQNGEQMIKDEEFVMNRKKENGQNVSRIAEIGLDKMTRSANNAQKQDDSNGKEREERILNEAVKDFASPNSDNNSSLPTQFFLSNQHETKDKTEISEEKESTQNYCNINLDHDIKTFEDALIYFGLNSHLLDLEKSLDQVKNRQKTKEEHEQMSKRIDKEMQKLSLRYHPDKIISRGGTQEEMVKAEQLQAILNASRAVLNILGEAFLEEIYVDHKYAFYSKLHMSSLGNENEIKNRIYEVLFEISMISEIKQRHIISEIRKFLIDSKYCINYYFSEQIDSFKKHKNLALFHLQCCITGYEKLYLELDDVEKQCENDKLDNISFVIRQMAADCKRDLTLLKMLQDAAKNSGRNYTFFNPVEPMDPYFVLPFVSYVNVILMCDVMRKNIRFWNRLIAGPESVPKHNGALSYLMRAYYMVTYYSSNHNKELAIKIMEENGVCSIQRKKDRVSNDVIQDTFLILLVEINEVMESKFRVDSYVESCNKNSLKKDLEKCWSLMHEFKEKEHELVRDIEKFKRKTQTMEEELEKYGALFQRVEELNRKVEERLKKSKKYAGEVTLSAKQ